ncbi:Zinc finger, C2H2-like [Phytophthora cactorum]|nr:Zinc finger, C2H2-like [Phytophthora cactorum]
MLLSFGIEGSSSQPTVRSGEVQAALAEVQRWTMSQSLARCTMMRWTSSVNRLVDYANPALAAIHQLVVDETSWHTLRSSPGGADQAVHRDFPNFESIPCAVNTRIGPSVCFRGINGRYVSACMARLAVQSNKQAAAQGDLAHAGAGFTRFNVRLHCYVRVCGVPQEPNSTDAMVFRSYLCRRYMQLTYSRAELQEHRQTCLMRDGQYTCRFCGQMYAIRNSLNQHIRRRHRERQEQDVLSEGSWSDSDSVEGSTSSDDA